MPAYREESVIARSVTRLREDIGRTIPDVEVVVVDDGSDDATSREAASAGARVVRLEQNRGKGAAVRRGVAAATGRTVVFTDADLAYSPDQVLEVASLVEAGWDVVLGSRHVPGAVAEVPASALRRAGGWVVNRLVRLVVGDHSDTQCGLKAFRSDVASLLFGEGRIDGFGFDIEVVALAERHGLAIATVPVRVVNSTGSSVRVVRDGIGLVVDLLRLAWWLRRGAYTPAGAAALPPPEEGDGEG